MEENNPVPQAPISQDPQSMETQGPMVPSEPVQTPTAPPEPAPMPQANIPPTGPKSNTILWIAVILLVLSALGAGAYYLVSSGLLTPRPTSSPSPSPTESATPAPTADSTANWKTYKSTFWNIELKYPSEMKFANTMVLEQEVLRFEDDNGYMQIENACATEIQGNQEDTLSLLGSVFPRYRLSKSGEFNLLSLHTNELKATDKRCMYIIFGLKPDNGKNEKLLFDQILSTFKFLEATPSSTPSATP